MKGILSKKIIFSALVFFALPFFVNAQNIDLRYTPTYPASGDMVSISLSAFGVDINTAEISWYKDGNFERKGVGMKNFNFTLGANSNVIRSIIKTGSSTLEKSVIINSSSMDVLWEVVGSYEPPFYKGKIHPIKGSTVRVVAIPQIKDDKGLVPDSGRFIYGWKKDGNSFAGQSGFGANSFSYQSQILDRDNTIEVEASGLSRALAKSVTITPTNSEIHFYEYSLVYGPMYNKAVRDNQTFNTRRINILAEPYFIFTKNIENPLLETEWRVNNLVNNPPQKNLMLMNIADNINTVNLSFKTDNTSQLLQGMTRNLRLNISN